MGLFAFGGMLLSGWIAYQWGPSWEEIVHAWLPAWLNSPSPSGFTWFSPTVFSPAWFNPAWFNPRWLSPASLAAILFGIPAGILIGLALRPAIEIHERHLKIGRREIGWGQIRRLDQTGWHIPLAVYLTVRIEQSREFRLLLIHPGDAQSSTSLLRYLRRYCREALLDGIPYREFWGEPSAPTRKQLPPQRYQLLLPEEEEEVERMFQRLKTVGHLDQRGADEK